MALTFLRIETRGGHLVAVFDRGFQSPIYQPYHFDNRYTPVRLDDGTFCLNEESLRMRIANVESQGRNASVERHALDVMIATEKGRQ